eukprot:5043579-Pleurochrysis_carterae.AAC.4
MISHWIDTLGLASAVASAFRSSKMHGAKVYGYQHVVNQANLRACSANRPSGNANYVSRVFQAFVI